MNTFEWKTKYAPVAREEASLPAASTSRNGR